MLLLPNSKAGQLMSVCKHTCGKQGVGATTYGQEGRCVPAVHCVAELKKTLFDCDACMAWCVVTNFIGTPAAVFANHAAQAHAALPAAAASGAAAAVATAADGHRLLCSATLHLQAKPWLQSCVWPHLLQ
jgi:hypothetical protein